MANIKLSDAMREGTGRWALYVAAEATGFVQLEHGIVDLEDRTLDRVWHLLSTFPELREPAPPSLPSAGLWDTDLLAYIGRMNDRGHSREEIADWLQSAGL